MRNCKSFWSSLNKVKKGVLRYIFTTKSHTIQFCKCFAMPLSILVLTKCLTFYMQYFNMNRPFAHFRSCKIQWK
jgi:hypothetical protein